VTAREDRIAFGYGDTHQGGEYWLYRYKKYTMCESSSPEEQIAFSGDPDNSLPRYDLILRYFDLRKWKTFEAKDHLKWNPEVQANDCFCCWASRIHATSRHCCPARIRADYFDVNLSSDSSIASARYGLRRSRRGAVASGKVRASSLETH